MMTSREATVGGGSAYDVELYQMKMSIKPISRRGIALSQRMAHGERDKSRRDILIRYGKVALGYYTLAYYMVRM